MKVSLAVYNVATGAILRVVRCPESAGTKQALEGEAVVKAGPEVSDLTHKVVNGAVVAL